MMSGGIDPIIGSSLIGAGSNLIGGALGGLFGGDEPAPAGYNKERGSEARRMSFGSRLGSRMRMGDPTIEAYMRSQMVNNPDLMHDIINDYGADLRPTDTGTNSAMVAPSVPAGTTFAMPPAGWTGSVSDWNMQNIAAVRKQQDKQATQAGDQVAFERMIQRMKQPAPGTGTVNYGYSGFGDTQPQQIAGFARPPAQSALKMDVNLNRPAAGSGNKYAKLNQERK